MCLGWSKPTTGNISPCGAHTCRPEILRQPTSLAWYVRMCYDFTWPDQWESGGDLITLKKSRSCSIASSLRFSRSISSTLSWNHNIAWVRNLVSHEESHSPVILPFKGQTTEVSESELPLGKWMLIIKVFKSLWNWTQFNYISKLHC